MNPSLLFFLLLPVACGGAVWWFVGQNILAAKVGGIFTAVGLLIVGGAFWAASSMATSDTEIWNGQITNKARVHGSYTRSYSCNCTTDSKGNQSCQTCYEDHYTVKWNAASTIGNFTIDSADWTSSRVYNLPNPSRWGIINPGDPASRAHSYTNYVQAVPESLFKPSGASLKKQFAPLLPAYPDQIYDIYRSTHFLTPGYSTPDAGKWNDALIEMLKTRGPVKQVNAIVVIAKTADQNYTYALQDAWEGANKNDVVLVIGSAEWPKIDFVSVISWTKSELFKVQLRDEVMALGTIQQEATVSVLAKQIDNNFIRRRMREFAYLKAEIDPPTWLLVMLATILVGGAGGLIFYVNKQASSFTRGRRVSAHW